MFTPISPPPPPSDRRLFQRPTAARLPCGEWTRLRCASLLGPCRRAPVLVFRTFPGSPPKYHFVPVDIETRCDPPRRRTTRWCLRPSWLPRAQTRWSGGARSRPIPQAGSHTLALTHFLFLAHTLSLPCLHTHTLYLLFEARLFLKYPERSLK